MVKKFSISLRSSTDKVSRDGYKILHPSRSSPTNPPQIDGRVTRSLGWVGVRVWMVKKCKHLSEILDRLKVSDCFF
jgi:hypothetical protein